MGSFRIANICQNDRAKQEKGLLEELMKKREGKKIKENVVKTWHI